MHVLRVGAGVGRGRVPVLELTPSQIETKAFFVLTLGVWRGKVGGAFAFPLAF